MGENYVLGNRDDRNEHFPYKLDPRMFENNRVVQIACGSNHIVVLALEEGAEVPILDVSQFVVEASAKAEVKADKVEQPIVDEDQK